jgi:hypothetical protein
LMRRPDMIPIKLAMGFTADTCRYLLTRVVTEKGISKTAETAGRKEQGLSLDRIASTDFLWS